MERFFHIAGLINTRMSLRIWNITHGLGNPKLHTLKGCEPRSQRSVHGKTYGGCPGGGGPGGEG